MYENHTTVLRNKLPSLILNAQIVNILLAISFFYFIPYFGITPKTNLFIDLIISSIAIFFWRLYIFPLFHIGKKAKALLIGTGSEISELQNEVNNNDRYPLKFVHFINVDGLEKIDTQKEIVDRIHKEGITVVVIDLYNPKIQPLLSKFYSLIFSGVTFIEQYRVYETIFERVPFSLLTESWFLENVSTQSESIYDAFKRIVDILLSLILGIISLLLYPFVCIAIKIDDGGPIFINQVRVGKGRRPINILKFRTMQKSEDGVWIGETENKITKVGSFLRNTRIDELPQLWNIIRGDLSLIGPRPDLIGLEERLQKVIPYYSSRYLIKPGLSGWAQIKQDYEGGNISPQSIDETKMRLAYDLYYVENHSFFLDIKIALLTIKILLSRLGR